MPAQSAKTASPAGGRTDDSNKKKEPQSAKRYICNQRCLLQMMTVQLVQLHREHLYLTCMHSRASTMECANLARPQPTLAIVACTLATASSSPGCVCAATHMGRPQSALRRLAILRATTKQQQSSARQTT